VTAGGNFEGHNILFNPRLPKSLAIDPAEELNSEQKQKLEILTHWLSQHMRTIKLPVKRRRRWWRR